LTTLCNRLFKNPHSSWVGSPLGPSSRLPPPSRNAAALRQRTAAARLLLLLLLLPTHSPAASHVRRRLQRACHLDSHAARHCGLLQVPIRTFPRQDFGASDLMGFTSSFASVRRFAVVEKRWRASWEAEGGGGGEGDGRAAWATPPLELPGDHEVAGAFAERRKRFAVVPLVLRSACSVADACRLVTEFYS
jgi:hypothetical protein